ncbi:hypothetical protein MD484_g6022, partial [Candolleomyces efflorescens]
MALLPKGRLVVVFLSILWSIVTVWEEYLQFASDGSQCQWPDHKFKSRPEDREHRAQHVLVVADPQILDHRSYPGRGRFLTYLSRIIVDLNLRKNWWVAASKKPDAVVFLGDMMDGGRFDMSEEEYVPEPAQSHELHLADRRALACRYEEYYSRFKSIFKLDPSIPQYFVPGNHDTGLGFSQSFSPYTHLRYAQHFGEKNYVVQLANHTLTFIDAPGYVDEESKRLGKSQTFENWKPLSGGTLDFMKKFRQEDHPAPVILFTHIPLYRPDGRGCGPLRERGTIRPGVGVGYQNTLGKQSSQKLLELLGPSLVFSGDDHDYCEHVHELPVSRFQRGPHQVREVTVKSLSMAMGIKRPGFQLLSLAPPELRIPLEESDSSGPSYDDAPCLLPDQLGTYLHVYIPLLIISLIIIGISQFVSYRPRSSLKYRNDDNESRGDNSRSRPTFRLTPANLRPRRDPSTESSYSSSAGESLPRPSAFVLSKGARERTSPI